MKRLFFIIVALFFLVASCSKSKPDGILSDKKMSELMTEVYILDSYLNTLPIDSGRKVMPVLYQGIFDKYDMDSTLFEKNVAYYYGNPVELEKVNTSAKDILTKYQKESTRTDSIEQARVRDSVNTVMHLQQWASEMRELILNVHLDTTEYTFGSNNSLFFQHVPVQVFRHELIKPVPAQPVETAIGEVQDSVQVAIDSTAIDSTKRVERRYIDSTMRKLGIKEIKKRPLDNYIKKKLVQ